LGSKFFDERQADASEIRQLREHVDSLLKLNCSLRQTTLDMMIKEEMGHLRNFLDDTVQSIQQLLQMHRQEHLADVVGVASEAATQATNHAAKEKAKTLAKFANLWNQHANDLQSARQEDGKTLDSLSSQVESLHQRLERMECAAQSEYESSKERFEKMVEHVVSELAGRLTAQIEKHTDNEHAAFEGLQAKLTGAVEESQSKLNRNISNMCELVPKQFHDCIQDNIRSATSDRCVELEGELVQMRKQATELQSDLLKAQCALDGITYKSPNQFLTRIREIEKRGNVKFNVRTGEVDIIKGMEFATVNVSEKPVAEWADAKKGEEALQDTVEILNMFDVPVAVESHTKGSDSKFWQGLASTRSEYIMDKLSAQGISKDQMVARGLPGKRGRNQNCMVVKMNMAVA